MLRIPLPLLLATVLTTGTLVTIMFIVVVKAAGAYDPSYMSANATHIMSVSLPSTTYVFIYGGPSATAYFTDTTTVYRFACVGYSCEPGYDFGLYFPAIVEVVSGSFPFGSIIEFNQPYGYTSYRVRIVLYTDGNGWVAGQVTETVYPGRIGMAFPVKWYQSGNKIYIYPVDRNRMGRPISEGCSVAQISGVIYPYVGSIQDDQAYHCLVMSWGAAGTKMITIASGVTTASWSLDKKTVTVTGSGYSLRVELVPLIFIRPAVHFAVKP